MKKVYIIENLDCANCAAKIEDKLNAHPKVEEAILTFSTKQLRLTAEDPDALIPELTELARTVEAEVVILPREMARKAEHTHRSEHHGHHEHGEKCSCGHHHEHEAGCHCGHEHHEHDEGCHCSHEDHEHDEECHCGQENHDHGDGCGCGHHHEHGEHCACGHHHEDAHTHEHHTQHGHQGEHPHAHGSGEKKELLLGLAVFLGAVLWQYMGFKALSWGGFIAAYVFLGHNVLKTAFRNLTKGHVFDENFLMSVATLGAFLIGEAPEAVGVMLFYRVGEYFEHRAVERSRKQIMEAVDLRPEVALLVEEDAVREIPAENVQVGDVLLIRPGDRIPLDGTVISGESRIDTAPITGEPVPVSVGVGAALTSGCVNTTGQLTMRVEKPLAESMVTRILDSVENAAASKPKIDRFITRFARIYTPVVVAIAVLTAVVPSVVTGDWNYWVYTALSFLVMSCPCALVLSVPLAFFAGIGAGSKKGILFKGGQSIEAMGKVKAVVMDKTGTLTRGDFKVQSVVGGMPLLQLCASCEQQSTHPIAASVVAAAKAQNLELLRPDALEELAGRGIRAMVQGSQVLCGNARLMKEENVVFQEPKETGTVVMVAVDGQFRGYLVIDDTLKTGAEPAVRQLRSNGMEIIMLTGDAPGAAKAVAGAVGIREVYAGLLPHQKLERLRSIRKEKGAVMFVGDGINDAPVLAGADVGAAMGSGADAAIEAADVVFMTSDVGAVPEALEIARETGKVAWQNVWFALAVKFAVMVLGLLGHASMWLAVFADSGVAMLCVLNSIRMLYKKG